MSGAAGRPITRAEKAQCVRRELALRAAVYPRRIADGKMTRAEAEHETAVMRAILQDYEPPGAAADLFDRPDGHPPQEARADA